MINDHDWDSSYLCCIVKSKTNQKFWNKYILTAAQAFKASASSSGAGLPTTLNFFFWSRSRVLKVICIFVILMCFSPVSINDPSKIERFHQLWERLCWNAAIWRPCGNFCYFLLRAYFCEKNMNWYQMHVLWMLKKKNLNIFCGKKSKCVWRA